MLSQSRGGHLHLFLVKLTPTDDVMNLDGVLGFCDIPVTPMYKPTVSHGSHVQQLAIHYLYIYIYKHNNNNNNNSNQRAIQTTSPRVSIYVVVIGSGSW